MTDLPAQATAILFDAVYGAAMYAALQPFWKAWSRRRKGPLYAVAAAWFVASGDSILTSVTVSHMRAPSERLAKERYLCALAARGGAVDPGMAEPVTVAVRVDE